MTSANTFGTFLETLKTLETGVQQRRRSEEPDVFTIARMLAKAGGSTPLKSLMNELNVSGEALFGAVVAGRDKGLFEIDEEPDEPVLRLSKLGRSLAG
jgi:hypothetical protein